MYPGLAMGGKFLGLWGLRIMGGRVSIIRQDITPPTHETGGS